MEGRMGTMGDEPIERPEREEARSGEAERAVKEVGSAKSARDADAAGKEGAEPYKPGSFEGGIVEFPSGDEPAVPPRKRLPLVLAIIGLVLCFTGSLALVGAACGVQVLIGQNHGGVVGGESRLPQVTFGGGGRRGGRALLRGVVLCVH